MIGVANPTTVTDGSRSTAGVWERKKRTSRGAISKTKRTGMTYFNAVENKPQTSTRNCPVNDTGDGAISTQARGQFESMIRFDRFFHYYIRKLDFGTASAECREQR